MTDKERLGLRAAKQTGENTMKTRVLTSPFHLSSLSMGASAGQEPCFSASFMIICRPQSFAQHIAYSRHSANVFQVNQ